MLAVSKLARPARLFPQQPHERKQTPSPQTGVETVGTTGSLHWATHCPGQLTETLGTVISKFQVGKLRLGQLFTVKIKAL